MRWMEMARIQGVVEWRPPHPLAALPLPAANMCLDVIQRQIGNPCQPLRIFQLRSLLVGSVCTFVLSSRLPSLGQFPPLHTACPSTSRHNVRHCLCPNTIS